MSKVTPILLNDTLNLIQLARETALAGGKAEQAKRLTPVVNEMRNLVATARDPQAAAPAASNHAASPVAPPPSGLMGQNDFRALLAASAKPASAGFSAPVAAERNQVVSAMAQGGMSELDIARQMGMTRDEVQMILSIYRA